MKKLKQKLSRIRDGNQGFTLVELLISITIFSVFVVGIFQYMATAAKLNAHVSSAVTLQMQAQTAIGNIEEYLIDCSGAVFFDDNALYIINNYSYDGSEGAIYAFRYMGNDTGGENEIRFRKGSVGSKRVTTITIRESITGIYNSGALEGYKVEYFRESQEVYNDGVLETSSSLGASTDAMGSALTFPATANLMVSETLISASFCEFLESSVSWSHSDWDDGEILSKNVDSFLVDFTTKFNAFHGLEKVEYVNLTFDMSNSKETYVGNAYIKLRNEPPNSGFVPSYTSSASYLDKVVQSARDATTVAASTTP